jgi:hypothetical protein
MTHDPIGIIVGTVAIASYAAVADGLVVPLGSRPSKYAAAPPRHPWALQAQALAQDLVPLSFVPTIPKGVPHPMSWNRPSDTVALEGRGGLL